MKFEDRYASAVNATNLKSEEMTLFSSSDVLAAAGWGARKYPLAFALYRLLVADDNRAADEIVTLLAERLVSKSSQWRIEISETAASFMARLILDWYRDPLCKTCGGHGYERISGTPTLGDKECNTCSGVGRRRFEAMFAPNRVALAKWGANKLEQEMSRAGPEAMRTLRVSLDL